MPDEERTAEAEPSRPDLDGSRATATRGHQGVDRAPTLNDGASAERGGQVDRGSGPAPGGGWRGGDGKRGADAGTGEGFSPGAAAWASGDGEAASLEEIRQGFVDFMSSRWSPGVVTALQDGPLRASALSARIGGISNKVLSTTLQRLVAEGFVERSEAEYNVVTYALTARGESAAECLAAFDVWLARRPDPFSDSGSSRPRD